MTRKSNDGDVKFCMTKLAASSPMPKLTDVRFAGRQIRVRYDGVNLDSWRIGTPRLDVAAGELR